jgi:hypothetical protein
MNYTNYEGKIVERFGVALIGWPCNGPVSNPNNVGGRAEVSRLVFALRVKQCKWLFLNDDELQERKQVNMERHSAGEQVYKPRRKGVSTKLATSASISSFTSPETVDSDADDHNNTNDNIDGQGNINGPNTGDVTVAVSIA